MIPLKLTLENFKCYRQGVPTLHLEGVHIACLCGPNGHGKSSLLEAIAWALWGDAVHRPQGELVHQGQQEMRVELEFLAREVRYRVIRRHARKGRSSQGNTSLELQVSSEGSTAFRAISGNTVRETEAQIRKLVGMDYDTFKNSAYLLQGRANEFTANRPAERKRILGEILGLGFYDRLQERARQRARAQADAIHLIKLDIQGWTQEVARRTEYEGELLRVVTSLKKAATAVAETDAAVKALRRDAEQFRSRAKDVEDQKSRTRAARQELETLQARIARYKQEIKAWELLLEESESIQADATRLKEARNREEAMGQLLAPYNRLLERKISLEQREAGLPALEQAHETAQRRLRELEASKQTLEERRLKLQEMRATVVGLQGENNRLRRHMEDLRARLDKLEEGDEQCPLCGTELGVEGKQHIVAEYDAQGKAYAESYRRNASALQEVEPQQLELHREVSTGDADLVRKDREVHGRVATLTLEIEQAKKASPELASLRQELDQLGYDPEAHAQARQAIQEGTHVEERYSLLKEATRRLPQEQEDLERDTALAQRRETEVSQGEEYIQAIGWEIVTLPSVEERLENAEESYRVSQQHHATLQGRRAYLEEHIQEALELEARKSEREELLRALTQEQELYEELGMALGKTGVQAMLIEAAMPELEAEANRLLGQMTDNTMHLKLETQRETQRGEAVETLEIKVADELGTRSYETFSGGEAFRINFALRIALSRLLAHRSGAPLPTLLIDEGFGTQDVTGRERLLSVIQSIAAEFQCILVITHMEEVKEAFPVRIEVEKTLSGSTFSIT